MRIEHIALYVRDLEASAAFYETYFQGRRGALYHNPRTCFSSFFLSFSDGARLELMTLPGICDPGSPSQYGYAHIAFQLGSKEAVDQLTVRMARDGFLVKSYPRTTGDGYYESCLFDPDGNQIELTE